MATRTIVKMVDDLDGESEATNTAVFAWESEQYEVDLNDAHFKELADFIHKFIEVGRRVGRTQLRERKGGLSTRPTTARPTRDQITEAAAAPTKAAPGKRDPAHLKAIRDWAVKNGYEVSPRGRIAADVEEAFETAMAVPK